MFWSVDGDDDSPPLPCGTRTSESSRFPFPPNSATDGSASTSAGLLHPPTLCRNRRISSASILHNSTLNLCPNSPCGSRSSNSPSPSRSLSPGCPCSDSSNHSRRSSQASPIRQSRGHRESSTSNNSPFPILSDMHRTFLQWTFVVCFSLFSNISTLLWANEIIHEYSIYITNHL